MRWDESLFPRTWGWRMLEGVLFETMSSYTTHTTSKTGKSKNAQRTMGDFNCLFHHLWIKSNINSHLPRIRQWCLEPWLLKSGTKVRGVPVAPDETPRESLSSQLCRRTSWLQQQAANAPARHSLILTWPTLRAESLQAGPSLHSQTYPGLVGWEALTEVGPDGQIKCLPEFLLS